MCRLTGDDDKDTKDSEEQVTPAISEDGSVSRAEDVFFALSLEGLGKYPEGLSCFVDGKEVNDEEPKEKEKPSEEEPKAIFVFARSSFQTSAFFFKIFLPARPSRLHQAWLLPSLREIPKRLRKELRSQRSHR